MDRILSIAAKRGASDVHIVVGLPPIFRIDGVLALMEGEPITPQNAKRLIFSVMDEKRRNKFLSEKELDFAYALTDELRFRVNLFFERGNVGAAFRIIPNRIRSIEELELPLVLKELAKKDRGLVLVTGPTGSGKNTTLAAMLDFINTNYSKRIVTIENPIEYLHRHKKSVITQREVGSDTDSFAEAIRRVLRQDPDVILIGEMRDLETISAAITAAETGHLVMSTLHTPDAPQSIDRIIDVFPPSQQHQIRMQLSVVLEGIIAQRLLPRVGGGRIVATEVLVGTPAVRNLIREGKAEQLYSVIQTGARFGMHTMDQDLVRLYRSGRIDKETFKMSARNVSDV
ncbi:MAG: PilT/PilU family type 4a pilus ATPase [Synergistetes bacterium]|nr:PilT/PilU family type 4a pilus ATPase [Synergistota bacterium]